MSEAETPEAVLNRISGVLGVDTVFYIEGKKVYLGVHTSAKRIESQMEAIVVFTNQFPDYVVYVMGDFNVLLSPSGTTALQIHSKSLSESEVNANNVQVIIDFHRPLTFIQPPVDTTCKRRWETTQGEKVGVSFSVKIDYIFRVNLAGETAKVTEPTQAHLFEHDVELTVSRPPAPWYPADHFTLEVQLGDEIFRSWNICGESQTADASSAAPAASRPASAAASARASQKVVQSNEPVLAIAPNCFEFLTANANAFYNEHLTEINEHFNRVMDEMPDYDGVRFRHRYLGASSLPADTPEEEKKKLKAGEISSVLRNCPSVNIHYKAFLLEEPEKVSDLTSPLPPLPADQHDQSILAMEVASPEENAEAPVEAVVVEGAMTPLGGDFSTPSGKILSESATAEAVAVTEVDSAAASSAPAQSSSATDDLPKSPRVPVNETTVSSVLTEKAKVQMRLLKSLFETADAQFRAGATPLQLALYEQYMEFRRRLEEIPLIRTLLTLFFNEVTAFDRQDFLYVLLPALKTRRVKVWALQEVSAPLQAKLDKLSRVLQQEYGYEMVRREIPADQKTWGVLLVRQDLQL